MHSPRFHKRTQSRAAPPPNRPIRITPMNRMHTVPVIFPIHRTRTPFLPIPIDIHIALRLRGLRPFFPSVFFANFPFVFRPHFIPKRLLLLPHALQIFPVVLCNVFLCHCLQTAENTLPPHTGFAILRRHVEIENFPVFLRCFPMSLAVPHVPAGENVSVSPLLPHLGTLSPYGKPLARTHKPTLGIRRTVERILQAEIASSIALLLREPHGVDWPIRIALYVSVVSIGRHQHCLCVLIGGGQRARQRIRRRLASSDRLRRVLIGCQRQITSPRFHARRRGRLGFIGFSGWLRYLQNVVFYRLCFFIFRLTVAESGVWGGYTVVPFRPCRVLHGRA
eukprot:comp19383_c0_seq1/m.22366 comp19383_c0_seq1/g.22366  ORF comp19383_c0_seq1/g.22366 comp19383_c0_seq1/m.22366 type:complete len:336 (+) comp19383_c0_seq1:867-1874(+)